MALSSYNLDFWLQYWAVKTKKWKVTLKYGNKSYFKRHYSLIKLYFCQNRFTRGDTVQCGCSSRVSAVYTEFDSLDSEHRSGQRPLDRHTGLLQTIPQLRVTLLDLTPPSKASLCIGEGYTTRYSGQNQTLRSTQSQFVLKRIKKVCRHTFLCEALS